MRTIRDGEPGTATSYFHTAPEHTWCLTSTETIRLIRDGEEGVRRWGKREIIYLTLHYHQNDSSIKTGSDESHFNVSVERDGQGHKTVSTNHNLYDEKGAGAVSNRGPSAYQPNALPLGHTGSLAPELMK